MEAPIYGPDAAHERTRDVGPSKLDTPTPAPKSMHCGRDPGPCLELSRSRIRNGVPVCNAVRLRSASLRAEKTLGICSMGLVGSSGGGRIALAVGIRTAWWDFRGGCLGNGNGLGDVRVERLGALDPVYVVWII